MLWILAPGEGPENCGEPGHCPLWLGDTIAYGELGSTPVPRKKDKVQSDQWAIHTTIGSHDYTTVGHVTEDHFSGASLFSLAQQTRLTTRLAITATLLLTMGTGKAGLAHGYTQRRRRRGGPKRRGCPQNSTRGARGMDISCMCAHTDTPKGSSDSRVDKFSWNIHMIPHSGTHAKAGREGRTLLLVKWDEKEWRKGRTRETIVSWELEGQHVE